MVALFFFAVVAVIASNLTARVRDQAVTARQRAKTTEGLYLFSRKLAGAVTLDDLLWATAYQIALMLKVRVVLLLPEDDSVAVRAGYPPEDNLDDSDLAAAKWCWQHHRPAGRGSDTLPGAKRLFLLMHTGRGSVGVVGLDSDRPGPLLSPDQRRLLDALTDQAALAIERVNLAQDVDRARLAAETERMRSALLTSISHDLRTPLSSILGSATSLRLYRQVLDDAAQQELIGTIQEEAERLNQFIANLLDMTRLESGAITPRMDLVDLADIVGSALERARKVLAAHRVEVDLAADLPMLRLDPVLFEQVLFNLLDNAAKYAPDRYRNRSAGLPEWQPGPRPSARRRRRDTARRFRAYLRQVLSRPCRAARPQTGRDRPRPRHLSRLRGGDGRYDRRRQSAGSQGRDVHHLGCLALGHTRKGGRGGMSVATPTRVLVVDDEPTIRRFLRTSLSAQGFQVTEAH